MKLRERFIGSAVKVMNLGKLFLVAGLTVVMVIIGPASLVMAGYEGQPPTASEKLIGPEMWGVVIIETGSKLATLRVKKIEDCVVDTDPQKTTLTSVPTSAGDALFIRLSSGSVFGLGCTPIITQVKNYKHDTGDGLISFDCQIKFVVPLADPRTKCQ